MSSRSRVKSENRVLDIYRELRNHHGGCESWWPADEGPLKEWEICVGAILTQNTNWKNVEKALTNLKHEKMLNPKKMNGMPLPKLQRLIRPSGFYKQKAARLKMFAGFVSSFGSLNKFLKSVTREQLLAVDGIGPETADSILLYACNKPHFVIDAYTRRILSRLKMISVKESYDELQRLFHESLPRSVKLYKEFHALIVEHAKQNCKKEPLCTDCTLNKICKRCLVNLPRIR